MQLSESETKLLLDSFGDSQDRINLQKLTDFFPLDLEDMQPEINEKGIGMFSALFTEEVRGDTEGNFRIRLNTAIQYLRSY